jgi:hypothetical protein
MKVHFIPDKNANKDPVPYKNRTKVVYARHLMPVTILLLAKPYRRRTPLTQNAGSLPD